MTYFTQQGQEASREQQQSFCAACGAIIVPFSDSMQEPAIVSPSKSKPISDTHDGSSPSIAKSANVVSPTKQKDSTNNDNVSEDTLERAMPGLDSDEDYDLDELSDIKQEDDDWRAVHEETMKMLKECLKITEEIKNDPFVTRLEMTRKFFTYD